MDTPYILGPSIQPAYWGQYGGSPGFVVRRVRGLGPIGILDSYLLLVWSEWNTPSHDCFTAMKIWVREDFGGIWMWYHRDDLIQHLGHVQSLIDRGFFYLIRFIMRGCGYLSCTLHYCEVLSRGGEDSGSDVTRLTKQNTNYTLPSLDLIGWVPQRV